MFPIYICEDQKVQREQLEKLLKNWIMMESLDMEIVCSCGSGEELLEYRKQQTGSALYFLDVNLGAGMDGITLAAELRKLDARGFLVFLTTEEEQLPMTFRYRVEAMDYIIKDKPEEVTQRIYDCLQETVQRLTMGFSPKEKLIVFAGREGARYVYPDDIYAIMVEKGSKRLQIYLKQEIFNCTGTLKEIWQQLPSCFIQSHKSCILNKNHVREMQKEKNLAVMENGNIFPVSARKRKELLR